MSISSEIDYKLLTSCFELDNYDNLYKAEYMEQIRSRRQEIIEEQEWNRYITEKQTKEQIEREGVLCRIVGQRILMQ